MSGLCRDCRFWREPFVEVETDGLKVCGRARSWLGDRQDEKSLAFARDAEEYAAELCTAPDFGCVQFEANERSE